MRLIDADALKEKFGYTYEWYKSRTVTQIIENAPTVERPKGKWIPMKVSSGRDSWKCSICGRRARGKLSNLPFCHCGADMREADNV